MLDSICNVDPGIGGPHAIDTVVNFTSHSSSTTLVYIFSLSSRSALSACTPRQTITFCVGVFEIPWNSLKVVPNFDVSEQASVKDDDL